MGLVTGLWFVRELIPTLAKLQRGPTSASKRSSASSNNKPATPSPATGADASGSFAALTADLATRAELAQLRGDVKDGLRELGDKVEDHQKTTNEALTLLTGAVGRLEGIVSTSN